MKEKQYKLADSVLHRIIQMLQEAMLVGVDVADLMRQMRLTHSDDDQDTLVLTKEYTALVREWHNELLSDAERLNASSPQQEDKKLIIG